MSMNVNLITSNQLANCRLIMQAITYDNLQEIIFLLIISGLIIDIRLLKLYFSIIVLKNNSIQLLYENINLMKYRIN